MTEIVSLVQGRAEPVSWRNAHPLPGRSAALQTIARNDKGPRYREVAAGLCRARNADGARQTSLSSALDLITWRPR